MPSAVLTPHGSRFTKPAPLHTGKVLVIVRNQQEQNADARPTIAAKVPDTSGYDTVLIGSPVWNMRAPMTMSAFVESADLTGKSILPFVTYAVSGLSGTDDDYRAALPNVDVGDGLAIRGEIVADAGLERDEWLKANALAVR
ncbi:flavodoxin [Antricoccus suffuscus]|uniref:Flavodoxin n=1 Tax=Antricoccus suffuscus TaxID=1629062 RepID=A0A2T1A5P7_9ACTN|nr:flavodoxin [Antricoccus suffuscus]PRZ43884.1 flavodoxin [Antricoccus suffuscus]